MSLERGRKALVLYWNFLDQSQKSFTSFDNFYNYMRLDPIDGYIDDGVISLGKQTEIAGIQDTRAAMIALAEQTRNGKAPTWWSFGEALADSSTAFRFEDAKKVAIGTASDFSKVTKKAVSLFENYMIFRVVILVLSLVLVFKKGQK